MTNSMMNILVTFLFLVVQFSTEVVVVDAFIIPSRIQSNTISSPVITPSSISSITSKLNSMVVDDYAPSDYDAEDLTTDKQELKVDTDEDDAIIRDELKRELLLLASITNRGEYATQEERDIVIDLVTQLEALNPTPNPASAAAAGEWDLCLSSTQFFRSSPFFLSIRSALGENNKQIADNGFDLHDRATSISRIGRVRQILSPDQLISEVDLEVGLLPGLPIRVKGTVVTTSSLEITSSETWELQVEGTKVIKSNVPLFNQYLDDLNLEIPMGSILNTFLGEGNVPTVSLKTFYVDEGIRITRDMDDNFFVFSRA